MNIKVKNSPTISAILDEDLSGEELDRALAGRHDEVEALLEDAHKAKADGRVAPLEPLHEFLRRARDRFAQKQ